jgi:diguanylate cyclase (GGDEF)-like protein
MRLDKLKFFESIITKELLHDNVTHSLFYRDGTHWIKLSDKSTLTQEVNTYLNNSVKEPIAHYKPGELSAWYFIDECNATLALSFPKSPRNTTRKKYREKIIKIQERADNAYRVSHHGLTQLLAKDAFREILGKEIQTLGIQSAPSVDAQEIELPSTLALLALDIDHFKQINDTWGHLYGDQVLKVFGKRLEDTAEKITTNNESAPTIYIGHPSGEEFLVLISGKATKEQFSVWANDFRLSISEEILPTEKEWTWLCKSEDLSVLALPPTRERSVSTSVGVTLHTSITKLTDFSKTDNNSSALLDLADTALYRAKAAGRNQVIFYDEILSSCGRTLEHDQGTGIIAIDIGTNVGVTLGQEFRVFHPTYTGKEKFLLNDGRTTRTLGTYPRVESARIVVFNSQPEISFAYIDGDKDQSVSIQKSSSLEAIPAGSIGHLLPNSSKYFPSHTRSLPASGFQTLQDLIQTESLIEQSLFVIVARFSSEPEYTKKYGTAALNNALARLYKAAQSTIRSFRAIELLDKASICIVGNKETYSEPNLEALSEKMAHELPELGILIGVINHADLIELEEQKIENISPEHYIELARFSASDAGFEPNTRIRHFSIDTAYTILQALRTAGSYDTAYADFEKLLSIGINSSNILNIGALTAGTLGHKLRAQELFKIALESNPGIIFKTNYAVESHGLGDIDAALEILNQIPLSEIPSIKTKHAFGYFTYAALLAEAKACNSPNFDKERFKLIGPTAANMEYASKRSLKAIETIKSALKD